MTIIQLLPTFAYGDAIGNDVRALHETFVENGYQSYIYAENIDQRCFGEFVRYAMKLPMLEKNDIILYHFSTGSKVMEHILHKQICKKIMVYHNITPQYYFKEYDKDLFHLLEEGRKSLIRMRGLFIGCIADSEFNKQDLVHVGYTVPIMVVPILMAFEDYKQKPDSDIVNKYKDDGYTNILFVGRIVPNKKQEEIIKVFSCYKRYFNKKARLFLVGNYQGMECYYQRLKDYVKLLNLDDSVCFTGHIPFDHILAYYHLADIFFCASEHEGFCVPLLEAMIASVPIVAYANAAIPETLGGRGVLVENGEYVLAAQLIDKIVTDVGLSEKIALGGLAQLENYEHDCVSKRFLMSMNQILLNPKVVIENLNMNPKDVNNQFEYIVNDMRKRTNRGCYGISEEFQSISVKQIKEKPVPMKFKSTIKQRILKPTYKIIFRFCPALAQRIREIIFSMIHGWSKKTVKHVLKKYERKSSGIIVDVTQTTKVDAGTGIERVVNNIFQQLVGNDRNIIAMRVWGNIPVTSCEYLKRIRDNSVVDEDKQIDFLEEDKLLLLDSSWEYAREFNEIIDAAHKNKMLVYAVVYDLFPIQYPELFDSQAFVDIFIKWHDMILSKADDILCISRTTADQVVQYYQKQSFQRDTSLNVHFFHMGANIPSMLGNARSILREFVSSNFTFLMVGTVEPRKGHIIALKAFVDLPDFCEAKLLIIGKNGWNNKSFVEFLKNNQKLQQCVMWIEDATDEELQWAYKNTAALIAASQDEGFGLPLIEAAHFGLPIICSDIPIFREVAEEHATYFKAMDARALGVTIQSWLQETQHPDSSKIRLYTWKDAAQEILNIIDGKVPPYKILN